VIEFGLTAVRTTRCFLVAHIDEAPFAGSAVRCTLADRRPALPHDDAALSCESHLLDAGNS
jgi:hypothetical protein